MLLIMIAENLAGYLIPAGSAVVVALIGFLGIIWQHRKTRDTMEAQRASNTVDHGLVIEAIHGLRGDVGEVRGLIINHVTDSSAHSHGERALYGLLTKAVVESRDTPTLHVDHAQIDKQTA